MLFLKCSYLLFGFWFQLCNTLLNCHCDVGYAPPACEPEPLSPGGSINDGFWIVEGQYVNHCAPGELSAPTAMLDIPTVCVAIEHLTCGDATMELKFPFYFTLFHLNYLNLNKFKKNDLKWLFKSLAASSCNMR